MKRLIIVDDEILVRIGLKSILNWEEHGYSIVGEAANGREAMEKINELDPDIVFTDLVMNHMDGFELIEQCSHTYPHIKFIVLSNYNDFESVKNAMKLGAVDYIFKLTSNPQDLLKILDETSRVIDREKVKIERKDDQMDMMMRKNIPLIKSHLIKTAVQQSDPNYKELMEEFHMLKLSTDFSKDYIVLYVSIDNYVETSMDGDISEIQLLKFSMQNIILEIVSKKNCAEVYDYDNGDVIVIVQLKEATSYESLCENIAEDIETIKAFIKRYLGVQISACVSKPCIGIDDLRKAVREAEKHLYQRFSSENNKLYFYEDGIREETTYVKQYVRNHLKDDLSVTQVAQVINMSESYFSHIFKKDMGMTFTDYVNSVRIAHAKELLQKSNLKVNEIAEQVGVYNSNYFSTLFKKLTGKSPNQFRSE